MAILRAVLLLAGAFCIAWSVASLTVNGVTVLGVVLLVAYLAMAGVFRWGFWFGDAEQDRRLSEVDEDLDRTQKRGRS